MKKDVTNSGTVCWFDSYKGVGCIINESGQPVSVDSRDIQSDVVETMTPKQQVTYMELKDDAGLFAAYVRPLSHR